MNALPDDTLSHPLPIRPVTSPFVGVALFVLILFVGAPFAQGAELPLFQAVRFEGIPDGALLDALKTSSLTITQADEFQNDFGAMMSRARDDKGTFEKILRSHGYYRPLIQIRVSHIPDKDRIELLYVITTGPQYRLREVSLTWNSAHPIPSTLGLSGIAPDQPVNALHIIEAEERLVNDAHEKGYPFAKALPREVTIDHAARTAVLVYHFDQGPYARFGATTYTGTEGIDTPYLAHKVPWKRDDPFRLSELEELRKRFEATSLFSRVKVEHGGRVDAAGHLQVNVTTLQRAPRTVRAGVYYRSDDKLGFKAGWEHRNLTGRADRLRVESDISAIRREGTFDYRLPELFDRRLSLNVSGIAADDTTVAYVSRYQDGSVTFDVRAYPWLTLGLGGGARRGETTTKATSRSFNYLLGYGVGFAKIDQTDSLLDPTWGLRLSGWASPYYGESDGDISFLKSQGNAELFVTYEGSGWSATLATRGEIGALFGADFERVPPDMRYYAGGAGTIRGYPYQTVGPDVDGTPLGGRSILTGSVEGRFRFGSSWGGVVFIDGGTAYEGETPDYATSPRFGGGFGVRYMTGFGPVRVDIAVPLSRRESDPPFQVYVGLGQAF